MLAIRNSSRCFRSKLVLVQNQKFHTGLLLNKNDDIKRGNSPRYDEAELFAPRITQSEYQAKKSEQNFQWQEKSNEQLSKEYSDRMEKMARLTAMFQGLAVMVAIGTLMTAYSKWPSIQKWYIDKKLRFDLKYNKKDEAFSKGKKKKSSTKKSLVPVLPVIPVEEKSLDIPGMYVWGHEQTNDSGDILYPKRVPQFDNVYMKDVCLSPNDNLPNLAIDEKGDLIKWDLNTNSVILKDQNLVKVKYSGNVAYALTKSGKILIFPIGDQRLIIQNTIYKRSWLKPWKTYQSYNLILDTKQVFNDSKEKYITEFDVGENHLILLSNKGNAYACSTGIDFGEKNVDIKSKGQFGLPTFSKFDTIPKPNQLYEIELLNKSLDENKNLVRREIVQVACGSNHTIARDRNGNIFSFGSNTYGQLGIPITYENEYVPFPKQIGKFQSYFTRDEIFKCENIYASDETSFVEMSSQTLDDYYKRNSRVYKKLYFSFGNGKNGSLGIGRFKNSQQDPTLIKVINDGNIEIKKWSCGGDQIICVTDKGEVLAWGDNSNGQLANGKRFKIDKPQNIPDILKPNNKLTVDEYFMTKLVLKSDKQEIATGKRSGCIFWKND